MLETTTICLKKQKITSTYQKEWTTQFHQADSLYFFLFGSNKQINEGRACERDCDDLCTFTAYL